MNKLLLVLVFGLNLNPAKAADDLEIPLYQMLKMNFNEADPSSNPEVMMRQFEYISSASLADILAFYRDSDHTQSCEYNDMADNYICRLAKHKKVSSGYVFIPAQSKGGEVTVLADYFFYP
ncbi:hypothetical protein OS175_00105 [Marinicella sp. S1101]|uniref:hypothetical protein n=1 Tax=Marinicella marina TaxID=2996016 RepID=UPI002260C68C|nr:hypothetical protein [Marinicella marina]MCX7552263.1 hypothetical protein [Marinicella marina]MDJ1139139.1 hypothetical protein [Marinicella marina]